MTLPWNSPTPAATGSLFAYPMAPPCHFYNLPPASVAPRPVSYENIPPTPSPGEFMHGQGPYHQESSIAGSYAPHTPTPPTKSSITRSAGRPLNETSSHNASPPLKRKTAPAASPALRKRQSPRSLQQKVTDGLKGIRASGFNSLGEFLQALFDPHASYSEQDQGPLQTVSAFIGGLNGDGQRPADIVEAWYSHPRNRKDASIPSCDAISSTIPKFSVPIGCKLTTEPSMTSIRGVSARWSLKAWASRVAISTIDEESEILANEPSFRAPEQWSWDMLDTISIKGFQEKVMKLAPLTWSLFTTIAVSPYRRDQIAEARNAIHRHGRFGLCTAYSTVSDHLKRLGRNAGTVLLDIGSTISRRDDHFIILFDNINKHHRAWHQTVSNADEVKSGTAATVIRMFSVPSGALNSRRYRRRCQKLCRKKLTTKKLLKDIDTDHITAVGRTTLLRIWLKHVPSLAKYQSHVAQMEKALDKHPIPLHRSEVYPLRTSGIDESTTAGNSDVLRDITHSQLGMHDDDFKDLLMPVAGDQLTVDRVRKLKTYTSKDISPYSRHGWALPVIQLWHMKWAFLKAIFKAHWTPGTGKRLFGLHRDCDSLGRTKLNPTKCDFYPHHRAVVESFEISCLGILRVLLEEFRQAEANQPCNAAPMDSDSAESTIDGDTRDPKSTKQLLEFLNDSFASNGWFTNRPFSFLDELAASGYRRHLCTAAYEDSLRDNIPEPDPDSDNPLPPLSERYDYDKKFQGDRVLGNLVLRLRDCLWYYEMCHATSHGDIGRVMEIIKILRFYFWGSGSTNYANELLELACNFLYEFPDPLQLALLNNWLINPTGMPGHWHELDLLQEHHNLLIKTLFNDRNADFDSSFLQEVIALNICGFSRLREFVSTFFDFTPASGKHADPDLDADINTLGACHQSEEIFTFHAMRSQSFIAPDFFAIGLNKLASGQLDTFKTRTTQNGNSVQPEGPEDAME
ncbi:hypothetical protein PLEOSDRAFT_1085428 [Pleurotus ostreatus PC15]|uniref:DUF6589 domain-containing protein n=1 Tax=Pleurotus ostreatus (strain PC15) TaxID=1137138 RepID=A0A067NGU2_PLEO1|nr:hypothetical protein PLEOSDRAFT_1085428 [Pleurotus ostreatus PC15]